MSAKETAFPSWYEAMGNHYLTILQPTGYRSVTGWKREVNQVTLGFAIVVGDGFEAIPALERILTHEGNQRLILNR